MSWTTAATYMTSGKNATSKAMQAAAGYLVGDICALTHGQPASVCSLVPKPLIGVTTTSAASHGSSVTPSTTAPAKAPTTTVKPAKKAKS
jgi:hypothetical protein